ncbi:MAG: hypothetical protein H0T41_07510 [Rhodobacteraceae bacterium]|nr:hypothetical protein [Paracoccaceae bacterium]
MPMTLGGHRDENASGEGLDPWAHIVARPAEKYETRRRGNDHDQGEADPKCSHEATGVSRMEQSGRAGNGLTAPTADALAL